MGMVAESQINTYIVYLEYTDTIRISINKRKKTKESN
jgi:hypothetical protein